MTCYILADGRLEGGQGDPSLMELAPAYRLDRSRYAAPKVTVRETLGKLYDTPARVRSRPTQAELDAAHGERSVGFTCRVDASGAASDCRPDPAVPASAADAARTVLSKYAFTPARRGGRPVEAYAGFTVVMGDHMIDRPNWLKKPSGDEVSNAFPAAALQSGTAGQVLVRCRVTVTGSVAGCRILREKPEGMGFGAAVLNLSRLFQMKPAYEDGVAVEDGQVDIPVNFKTSGAWSVGLQTVKVASWLPFSAAPDAAAVQAVFARLPAAAPSRVSFRCRLTGDGRLTQCDASPTTMPFAALGAVRGLLKDFRVDPAAIKQPGAGQWRAEHDLRRFRSHPWGREPHATCARVDWLRQPLESGVELYPPEAAKAGVLSGRGSVDCAVSAQGMLTDCKVIGEAPAGLGFGAAAVIMAQAMQVNLWTRDGEPAVGARVKMPLTFIDQGNGKAEATPAVAAK